VKGCLGYWEVGRLSGFLQGGMVVLLLLLIQLLLLVALLVLGRLVARVVRGRRWG
jgi:hypothetical protein